MKYCPMICPAVTHQEGKIDHHLEVGPLPENFPSTSVTGPFLRGDGELGCSREVVEVLKHDIVSFACVIVPLWYNSAYSPGLISSPITLT